MVKKEVIQKSFSTWIPIDTEKISLQSMRVGSRKLKDGRTVAMKYQPKDKMSTKLDLRSWFEQHKPEWVDLEAQRYAHVYIRKLHYYYLVKGNLDEIQKNDLEIFGACDKITAPDLMDNLSKLLMDCLTGIIIRDDARICHAGDVRKMYVKANPGIDLTLVVKWIKKVK